MRAAIEYKLLQLVERVIPEGEDPWKYLEEISNTYQDLEPLLRDERYHNLGIIKDAQMRGTMPK
jgi:hypothetical protein